jgi:hypothetical protein
MTYKHIRKNPKEQTAKQIEGGRLWVVKDRGMPGWSSEDGNFDILQGDEFVVLVSFIHDPNGDFEFWRQRCKNVREAMELAEKI